MHAARIDGHHIDKWIKSHFGHVISTATASTATWIGWLTAPQNNTTNLNPLNWTRTIYKTTTEQSKAKQEKIIYKQTNKKFIFITIHNFFAFFAVHIYMEFYWKQRSISKQTANVIQ